MWEQGAEQPVVTGLRTDRREVLITHPLDAEPDNRHEHPEDTIWPLIMALSIGLLFIVSIFTPWGVLIGLVPSVIAFAGWGWPRRRKHASEPSAEVARVEVAR